MKGPEFETLMRRLAAAWERLDAEAAADCFTDDAVYMEPPDKQLFQGRQELLAYFSPLEEGTYLDFHGVWFDEESRTGVVEFTFGVRDREAADHGVVVVAVDNNKIASWREYLTTGPARFDRFVSTRGKQWEWHAGNYP